MNALASPDAIETAASVEPAVESVIRNFVEQEYAARPPTVEFDGERIKNSVALFSSKSIKELEGLTFELKALQDFLKSETERVQHNIELPWQECRSSWTLLRRGETCVPKAGPSRELLNSAMRIALNVRAF